MNSAGQEFQARNSEILDSKVVTDSGATATIIQLTYGSGETVIIKRAKNPFFNKELRREYATLVELNADPNHPRSIPEVYAFFEPRDPNVDDFVFQMEDLSNYFPLHDRGHGSEKLDRLDLVTRVIILRYICVCLTYLTAKGKVHNDIQLSNILFKDDPLDVKIIDWAGRDEGVLGETIFEDVYQVAVMIPLLFDSLQIPVPIEQWVTKAKDRTFLTPQNAFASLDTAIQKSYSLL